MFTTSVMQTDICFAGILPLSMTCVRLPSNEQYFITFNFGDNSFQRTAFTGKNICSNLTFAGK